MWIFTNKLDVEADIVDTISKNKDIDFIKSILISNKANNILVKEIRTIIKKYKFRSIIIPEGIGDYVKYSELNNYDDRRKFS